MGLYKNIAIICFVAAVSFYGAGVHAGPYSTPTCAQGRHAITHLFEWKWSDIEKECVNFLGPYGYCGVQVSPPNENAVVTSAVDRPWVYRPWWERYQPVSYDLQTRSGNEQQFRSMVDTCNRHNVRIYVDVVINHMTGPYSGLGTAGHSFDGNSLNYPGVPFGRNDFNTMRPEAEKINYADKYEVRNCRLVGLADLRLGKDYVRGKIADYMNKLIDMGVAGFRVDAAKHMWPGDLEIILRRLHNLPSATFGRGKRPFVFMEVIDVGSGAIRMSEYFQVGRVTNFIYGEKLAEIFLRHSNQAKWLSNWGPLWGMPKPDDVVVFINNHDNQRGHGGGGEPITFFDQKELKIATAFMLAHPYGFPRIMSSYSWLRRYQDGKDINRWMGPPHNVDMSTKDIQINFDMSCGGDWVCEHRWRQIYNMVAFRNVVHGTKVDLFWSGGDFQIAFARGDKGFIVINAGGGVVKIRLPTNLPAGTSCDVTGSYGGNRCTGASVNVDGVFNASISGNYDGNHCTGAAVNVDGVHNANILTGLHAGSNFDVTGNYDSNRCAGGASVNVDGGLDAYLSTGLPAGTYCDVISGNYDGRRCTGASVDVDKSGRAHFYIDDISDDPVIAIHIGAKLGSPKKVTT